jgi:predicted RNA binding protein YcfA (HicA-like mRNA interferase family)
MGRLFLPPIMQKGMKVKEMIQKIEADGWYFERQKGSHRQFRHSTKKGTVTVAGKPSEEIKRGTEKSILKQAGMK